MRIPLRARRPLGSSSTAANGSAPPALRRVDSDDRRTVVVEYRVGGRSHRVVTKRLDGPMPEWRLEPHLAAGLLPWMKAGPGRVVAEGELSTRFHSSLSAIQDIYCGWNRSLSRIELDPRMRIGPAPPRGTRVASLFSGGVDSLHALIQYREEITDLVFVHGWDIPLENQPLRDEVASINRETAAHFGKNLIEIETNVREMLDPYVNWGLLGHGAALAAAAHLLPSSINRIRIPSSATRGPYIVPWGSHPDLDPLWSTESMEFVHGGAEVTRPEKLALISRHPFALQRLRVCWKNPDGAYNCGRCEKCLRTMISLIALGVLDRCPTFPGYPDVRLVATMVGGDEAVRGYSINNLEALNRIDGHQELKRALRRALAEPRWRARLRRRMFGSRT